MIRKAESKDKSFCARMYYMAGPNLFSYFFSSDKDVCIKVIEKLFETKKTIFSQEYFYVFEDENIKAAIMLVPREKLYVLENNVMKYIFKLINILGIKKFIIGGIRSFYTRKFPKVNSGELFIHAISVDENYRGQHVGSKMLEFALKKADELGKSKLSLYVELDNSRAIKVYKKNGFEIDSTVNFSGKIKEYGVQGMYKMIRNI